MTKPTQPGPAAAKTAKMQRGKPFKAGQSGNPAGKAKGTRNAATLAMEALLDGQAEALTQKAIDLALAGDITALRLCLVRVLPARKDRPVTFALPPINTPQDAATTISAVLAAVAAGELTPSDASEISKLIEVYVETVKTAEFAERLNQLEKMTVK
jgi:Family of unknown function (DUF5681)